MWLVFIFIACYSVEAIGVSSALHPSSQPPSLLDSNVPISNLSISPVPHSSQPENVSSSQSHLSNLLYSFTCSSCKLHKRLAVVKCRKCVSFFHLKCVKLSRVQAFLIGSNWFCPHCSGIDHIPESVQIDHHLSGEAFSKYLQDLKLKSFIIRRIRKEARVVFADSLVQLIESVLSSDDIISWQRLLAFAEVVLHHPSPGSVSNSSSASVKLNISNFMSLSDFPDISTRPPKSNFSSKSSIPPLKRMVSSKSNDFDMKAVVRLFFSDNVFAPMVPETVSSLRSIHPLGDPVLDINPDQIPTKPVMTESSVRKAILSFPNGSGSGPDLLRPQHLKDIISPFLGASANSVYRSISRFASFVSSTKIPDPIRHLFFGAHLYTLQKKGGGKRPIAVGNTFRRLFSKLSLHSVRNSLREYLLPCRLGVGVRLRCESAVHATRSFINHSVEPKGLLKLDIFNAFNSIDRKTFIGEIATRYPFLYFLVNKAYSNPSTLAGEHRIPFSRGDPLSPALFALAVDKIIKDVSSELTFGTWTMPQLVVRLALSIKCIQISFLNLFL